MLTDDPLSFECQPGKAAGTRIYRLRGPLTMRNLFEFQAELRIGQPPLVAIFDLTGVPYMDSAGMGALTNYFVHCEKNGIEMIVAGAGNRVVELFKLTRVDTIIPLAATVEAAEARVKA
jgi:anti-anti-sigma factor